MNTDFSIRYWMSKGASPQQLLLGMGAYGRGFNLVDASNHGLYAPASSGIDPGMYTSARGFWGYNEFCEKMRTEQSQWTTVRVSWDFFLLCVTVGLWVANRALSKRELVNLKSFCFLE